MLRLVLTPALGGEVAVWERPVEGAPYIVACDPSQGRVTSEKSDTCCIGAWLRLPGSRLRQCAETVFRWGAYNGFGVHFRDWYFGNWLLIRLGWFGLKMGCGTYDE